ncbi:MAG TPA: guanylate kinase [Anaerohalosphaeraceae bacterium]|jgi:guanylate kinase|nr:guanylate kinase [Anaerohalosphaeraceae bacterium]HRT51797.1 guanylate kinase [Anaerohalosphaeraceae bacterium]HRT87815.1 guanylate kinase [Anaerohalosphaeraceae bacterium]
MIERHKGKLVIISGPSGVGKSTICRAVVERTGAHLSVSATTRPKAPSEVDGRDYHFMSREAFEQGIRNDEFLEYAEVFGNYYGTPRSEVEAALAEGRTVILEIDVQGARKVKQLYPDVIMIFILPPTQKDLADRMKGRGRGEDDRTAKLRLDTAAREIAAAWQYYKHMVINADLEQAIREVMDIIQGNTGEVQ